MTLQECYAALEGDYQEVLGRLYSEALVRNYTARAKEALDSGRWLGNTSFLAELADSLAARRS